MPTPSGCPPPSPITGTSSGTGPGDGNWTPMHIKPDDPDTMDVSVSVSVSNATATSNQAIIGMFTAADELIVSYALVPEIFSGTSASLTLYINQLRDVYPTFAKFAFHLRTVGMVGAWTATFTGTATWGDCQDYFPVSLGQPQATIVG